MVASVSLANQMGDPRRSDGGGGTITCAALAWFDAGDTWQRHDFPGRSCVDSWVAMLRDGQVVFLAQEGSELITFRSTTGGRTWTDTPTSFGRGFDHGSMVVDWRDNALYVVASHTVRQANGTSRSSAFIARSDDGGATFNAKTDVDSMSLPTFPLSPVVMSTGTLVVPIQESRAVYFVNPPATARSDLVDRVRRSGPNVFRSKLRGRLRIALVQRRGRCIDRSPTRTAFISRAGTARWSACICLRRVRRQQLVASHARQPRLCAEWHGRREQSGHRSRRLIRRP